MQLQEIDALGNPVYYTLHNVEAAQGTRTQAIQGGGTLPIALSGSSAVMAGKLGLWDGGRVLTTHQEFIGSPARVTHKDGTGTVNSHTTHLAGTLVGKGANAQAKGMAYGAQLAVWDYTNDLVELSTAASGLLVSNHAYGPVAGWVYNESRPGTDPNRKWEWWGTPAISATEDYQFGFYSTRVQDVDRLAYNNPFYLMVRSSDNKRAETGPPANTPYFLKNTATQSTLARSRNDAYDVIPIEATAKNVLTVGAADLTYSGQNQPVLRGTAYYSGWGPTDDGRIKPDLLGVGTDVFSTVATGNTDYDTESGTSMASANVSGSLFLLQELYAQQRAAGRYSGGSFMRAATLKGLAIHTADRPKPALGPDYRQGWGLLNTEAAAQVLLNDTRAHRLQESSLLSGGKSVLTVVAQGNEPLIITLSWTDPEGPATSVIAGSLNNRSPKLINDLDLRLTAGSQTYYPFVLTPDKPAQSASTGDNIRDNVEQIYLSAPVAGQTYTLTVSHKGKMTYASQPFSLFVSGLQRINCPTSLRLIPAADTTICEGSSITLQLPDAATTNRYQWLRNGVVLSTETTTRYLTYEAGSYQVRQTMPNGCTVTSAPVRITVQSTQISVSPIGTQRLCSADTSIRLSVQNPVDNDVYSWFQDDSPLPNQGTRINAGQPGNYHVEAQIGGCAAKSRTVSVVPTSVNELIVSPAEAELMLPPIGAITLHVTPDTSCRYQWFRNDSPLTNARSSSFTVTQTGTYRVRVAQQTCVGWSDSRQIDTDATLHADVGGLLRFFPNPAEQILSIRYTNAKAKRATVDIMDMHGITRQTASLTYQNGRFEADISVQQLPAGTYILRLTTGPVTLVERFTKK